jgi:hypothetical protein
VRDHGKNKNQRKELRREWRHGDFLLRFLPSSFLLEEPRTENKRGEGTASEKRSRERESMKAGKRKTGDP